jgi:hypothetical protein
VVDVDNDHQCVDELAILNALQHGPPQSFAPSDADAHIPIIGTTVEMGNPSLNDDAC